MHDYFTRLAEIYWAVYEDHIELFLAELHACRERDGTTYFFGNGGKAAIADEFANDLSNGVVLDKPFRCVSLCGNGPMMTAIANDTAYRNLFRRQLEIYTRPGDLVVGMSGSGHSENVIEALEYAQISGLRTMAVVGMDGGEIMQRHSKVTTLDVCLHIPTTTEEDGPIEDTMLSLCHLAVQHFRATLA